MGAKRPQLADRAALLLERLRGLEDVANETPATESARAYRRERLAREAIRFASVAKRYLGGADGR